MARNIQQIVTKNVLKRKYDAIVIGGGHNGLIAVSNKPINLCFH